MRMPETGHIGLTGRWVGAGAGKSDAVNTAALRYSPLVAPFDPFWTNPDPNNHSTAEMARAPRVGASCKAHGRGHRIWDTTHQKAKRVLQGNRR